MVTCPRADVLDSLNVAGFRWDPELEGGGYRETATEFSPGHSAFQSNVNVTSSVEDEISGEAQTERNR